MFDEFKNAFRKYNNGLAQLIIINVVIYIVSLLFYVIAEAATGLKPAFQIFYEQFSIPAPLTEFIYRPWTILSYAFEHNVRDPWHIIMNMLMLFWFGKIFVEYLGSDKLISVYVLGALAGATLYLVMFNTVPYFMMRSVEFNGLVGASAAVYAVVVATATLLPDYTMFLFFFGPVRIKYIAAITIVISFAGTVGSNPGGNIAHLGGAIIGFVYIKQLQSGNNWGAWIIAVMDFVKNLFKPRMNVKVTYRNERAAPGKSSRAGKGSNISEEELNAILDKISEGGYESLTKDEKEKLFNASKK